jgi:hypothetical protein
VQVQVQAYTHPQDHVWLFFMCPNGSCVYSATHISRNSVTTPGPTWQYPHIVPRPPSVAHISRRRPNVPHTLRAARTSRKPHILPHRRRAARAPPRAHVAPRPQRAARSQLRPYATLYPHYTPHAPCCVLHKYRPACTAQTCRIPLAILTHHTQPITRPAVPSHTAQYPRRFGNTTTTAKSPLTCLKLSRGPPETRVQGPRIGKPLPHRLQETPL